MQRELAHIHVDVLGDVRRQALHLDVARHEVEQAALLLDARRLALHDDGHGDDDRLVHRELVEVRVQELMCDRIELVFAHHHARLAALELQVDQRVRARLGVQDAQQLLGIDGDGDALGKLPLLARAVDHRRNLA